MSVTLSSSSCLKFSRLRTKDKAKNAFLKPTISPASYRKDNVSFSMQRSMRILFLQKYKLFCYTDGIWIKNKSLPDSLTLSSRDSFQQLSVNYGNCPLLLTDWVQLLRLHHPVLPFQPPFHRSCCQ